MQCCLMSVSLISLLFSVTSMEPTTPRLNQQTSQSRPLAPPPVISRDLVALQQLRSGPRHRNDYVDSPQLAHVHASVPGVRTPHVSTVKTTNNNVGGGGSRITRHDTHPMVLPPRSAIVSQPQSSTLLLKKDFGSTPTAPDVSHLGDASLPCSNDSIMCERCGKCKCHQCTQRRELPRRWLCNKKCECSATNIVEYCSCLCAVKCVFYHCFRCIDGDESPEGADNPCACCSVPHCCRRWTCMGASSLTCLPCLWLYWPLRCVLCVCTSSYDRCSRRGCHCRDKLPGSQRLLLDSESSST